MKCFWGSLLFLCNTICSFSGLQAQSATFQVTYTGFTTEAETAFDYAADLWTHYLVSDVPIEIVVHLQPLLPGQLGITFPNGELNFPMAPVNDVWYASCLANAIAGEDLSPGEADIEIYLNSLASWYYGIDGETPAGKYDFVSTVLHEICHGLGFLSLGNKTGATGSFGLIDASAFAPLTTTFPWPELDTLPGIFDVYLENLSGTSLTTMKNPSDALGTAFTGNQVYCNSPMVVEDNGGEHPKMYAPGSFVLGSSLSHWDEVSFPVGDPNELMTPQAAAANSNHSPGPLTLSLLDEIGWEIIYDTATIAVNDLKIDEIRIYPNPVVDLLNIEINDPAGIYYIAIYNAEGRIITEFEFSNFDHSISTAELSPGFYFIKITDLVNSNTYPFVKVYTSSQN